MLIFAQPVYLTQVRLMLGKQLLLGTVTEMLPSHPAWWSTSTHKHTVGRLEMWGSCGLKSGRGEKEAEGRRQTEGIIVHAHSCGLPCSKKHFPNTWLHCSTRIVTAPSSKSNQAYSKSLTAAAGYTWWARKHTHIHLLTFLYSVGGGEVQTEG